MKLVLCIALLASPFVVEGGDTFYRAPAMRSDQGEAGSFGSLGSGVGGMDDRWGIAIKGTDKALEIRSLNRIDKEIRSLSLKKRGDAEDKAARSLNKATSRAPFRMYGDVPARFNAACDAFKTYREAPARSLTKATSRAPFRMYGDVPARFNAACNAFKTYRDAPARSLKASPATSF